MSATYLDWDKLRVFSAVAELKSLTSAAKRLGESTPTVSRKIDDLERKLNCELLVRTPRGVELTEAGRVVEAHAQTMNEKANSIWNDVCALDLEGTGRIRMAAGDDGVMAHWLTRGIPQFQEDHPGIELEMTVTKGDVNLMSGDADLALAFEEPRQRDLVSLRLGTLHYMCFASQSYLDKYGAPESLYDFHGHKSLIHSSYVHQVDNWSPRVHELQKLVSFAVTTNSGTLMKEVCAQGGGIAVMPSYVVETDSRLVPLSLPELAPARFWLVYTQRMQRLSRGRIVIDWIRRQFSADKSPWFMDTFVHPNTKLPKKNSA